MCKTPKLCSISTQFITRNLPTAKVQSDKKCPKREMCKTHKKCIVIKKRIHNILKINCSRSRSGLRITSWAPLSGILSVVHTILDDNAYH